MPEQQKEGGFALFRNRNRRPDKNDPHYNGKVMINGEMYWMSLWKNVGGEYTKIPGETYLSGSIGNKVQEKQPKDYPEQTVAEPEATANEEFDDDIPF